jgi:hypothetical protein
MLNISTQQEKKVLAAAFAVLGILVVYRIAAVEKPKTVPLAFPPGSVSRSAVRQGLEALSSDAAPFGVFLARRAERYPGVVRDIFRMENPAPRARPAPVPVAPPSAPILPERTPEEAAADLSRAELARFRFLGYLTEKDSTLFLSKDGELFIVKSGEQFHKNYLLKQATRDSVLLLDAVTGVERRVDLSGDEAQQQMPPQQQPRGPQQMPQQAQQPLAPQMPRQTQQPSAQQQMPPQQQAQAPQQTQRPSVPQQPRQMQQPKEAQAPAMPQPAQRWMQRLRQTPMQNTGE